MQIELVETFLDLCETRSFNRTAERMGVTQSTVSSRVKALEGRLSRRLFRRSRAGTELTVEGMRFESHARALRLTWSEALSAVREEGNYPLTLRLSIQHDLAGRHTPDWLACLREVMPEARVVIEPDYSTQMCNDLMSGQGDVAILYSPRPHPDLHFESIGEVQYRMISATAVTLAEVTAERYVLAQYSPAFQRTHAALHPSLHEAPLVCGEGQAIEALLEAGTPTAYVRADGAQRLLARGFEWVQGAQPIIQSVYVAMHSRNRHRRYQRRLVQRLGAHMAARAMGI